jgi:hypothetical protein
MKVKVSRATRRKKLSSTLFDVCCRLTNMVVFSPDEILARGLSLMGIDHGHQNKVCRKTNLDCFRSLYGSNPVVYAQISTKKGVSTKNFPSKLFEVTSIKNYELGNFNDSTVYDVKRNKLCTLPTVELKNVLL